jgi:hypothetical protein
MPCCRLLLPTQVAFLTHLIHNALEYLVQDRPAVRAGRLGQLIQLRTYCLLLYCLYGLLILPRYAPTALLLLAVISRSYLYCCLSCLELRAGQRIAIHILAHDLSPAAYSVYEGLHCLAVIYHLLLLLEHNHRLSC